MGGNTMHILAKYTIGIGLILFGFFAMYFPTYDHPIYGHIDLGKYRVLIGVASAMVGAVYTYRIKYKNKR
jgi:hypothetical protein